MAQCTSTISAVPAFLLTLGTGTSNTEIRPKEAEHTALDSP